MPKASLSSKDASAGGFGLQEGFVEVVEARSKVHQYPASTKTGLQSAPFPCVQLVFQKTDENGVALDEEPVPFEFSIGKIEYFHPGKAESADDPDPEDMGTEVDVEGNCIYVTEEGKQLNQNCKWMRFALSLEKKGFKPEVLANGYMPDLIGLKCHVHTITLPKIPGSTSEKDPTALEADKILQFPYEAKKKGAAKAGKAPAKGAAKSAPAAPAAPAKSASVGGEDPEALALNVLSGLVEAGTFKGQESVERTKLQTACQTYMMRNKVNIKLHKPVMDYIKSDDWLTENSAEAGFMFDPDSNTCAFAE